MNEKNIYEMLNNVEINLEDYEEDSMTDFEKERAKKRFSQSLKTPISKSKKLGVSIAAALVLLVGITNNPVSAKVNMLLDSFTYSMSQEIGMDYPGKSYEVNQNAAIGDYQIKIADILLDEESITLNYLIESPEYLESDSYLSVESINLYINGQKVKIDGMHGGGKLLENGLFQSLSTYDFREPIQIKEDNEIKIQVQGIGNSEKILSLDSVEFAFKGSKEDLNGQAQTLVLNKAIESEVGNIMLEKFVFNPYQSQVKFSVPVTKDTKEMFFEANIIDENGRDLSFSGGTVNLNEKENTYECHLFSDDLGSLTFDRLLEAKNLKFQIYSHERKSGEVELFELGDSLEIQIEK